MADYQDSTTFAFDRAGLCWPVLFHVEPLITGYAWKADVSVTVSSDDGPSKYPDVAGARTASQNQTPHRVELYASNGNMRAGVWVVGFGDGEQPAVTIYSDAGMTSEWDDLRASVAEFLGRNGVDIPQAQASAPAPAAPAPAAKPSRWGWIANQPMAVQIVGGVIATLLASGIVALFALIVR